MRAGMQPALEKRLRCPDPTARLMVDALVQDREDVKITVADFNGADSLTGLSVKAPPQDVGVELSTTLAANLENTVEDGNMTDLDGPPSYDDASPFNTAFVEWGGSEPDSIVLQRVKAWLDPDTGAGQNVDQWILQVFAIRAVGELLGELDLVPIMDPFRVTAGASAGDVTFDLQGLDVRPKNAGKPLNGGTTYPDPTTVFFIWAVKSDGTSATNVGWGRDSADGTVTTAGNFLQGRQVTKAAGARYIVSGSPGGLPKISLDWASYATATITFSAGGAGNNIDLGAAPSNDLLCILRGFTPGGTSFVAEINDTGGWVQFKDGDLIGVDNTSTGGEDLSGVTKQQTYDIRCQLVTNGTTDDTPRLTGLGVAEVSITDLSNIASMRGGRYAVDPVDLKSEITQIQITAIRDGEIDYRDAITTLLSENSIAKIKFRVWWGSATLDRKDWFFVDAFNVRDYDPSGPAIVIRGVSALAHLKKQLPVIDGTPEIQPYRKTNATLKAVYDDLIQLALDGQYRGPGVQDNTTTVSKEVTGSTVKAELEAIMRCARGGGIASQGRVKFVQMFDDGAGSAHLFQSQEMTNVRVLPGFAERRPEFRLRYDYDFVGKRYQAIRLIQHTAALAELGFTGLIDLPELEDVVAQWIDTAALADVVGIDTTKALATGLLLWSFGTTYAWPELEPGDRVIVPTERFVAKDPLAARALRGHLWAIGRVQSVSVDARQFAVWIQGYTDIFTSQSTVTVTNVDPPTSLVLASTTAEHEDDGIGGIGLVIKATWTDPVDKALEHIEVQAKRDSDSDWDPFGFALPGEERHLLRRVTIASNTSGTGTEDWGVRIRTVLADGTVSAWVSGSVTVNTGRRLRFSLTEQRARDANTGVTPDTIACFLFEDGSGTTLKDQLGIQDATLSVAGAGWVDGPARGAYDFNDAGEFDAAHATQHDIGLTQVFTVDVVFKHVSGTTQYFIFHESDYYLRISAANVIEFATRDNWAATVTSIDLDSFSVAGQWVHLKWQYNGADDSQFWVNSVLADSTTASAAATGAALGNTLNIGHRAGGNNFDGAMAYLRISTALENDFPFLTQITGAFGYGYRPAVFRNQVRIGDGSGNYGVVRHNEEGTAQDGDAVSFAGNYEAPPFVTFIPQVALTYRSAATASDQVIDIKAENKTVSGFDLRAKIITGATATAISDGFSAAQNTAGPENGTVTLQDDGDVAYSNLEDANTTATTYTARYDVDGTAMVDNLVTVQLWSNDSATSTTWVLRDSRTHDNLDNLTAEELSFSESLGENFDLRLRIEYFVTPDSAERATVTARGENSSPVGVSFNEITGGTPLDMTPNVGDSIAWFAYEAP